LLNVFIDAGARPVKDEVYRVAGRYGLDVIVVANSRMRVPDDERVRLEIVGGGPDVADDWIVAHVEPGDIVVTADIPLASRCLQTGARAIGSTGNVFTEDNIGSVVATRNLMSDLRSAGE
jgi:uncharacterized protein